MKRTELEVQQTEWVYWAAFQSPAFELQASLPRLFSRIYSELSLFGVGLGDLRVEGYSPNPAEQSVVCAILRLDAAVRFRVDRLEVWSSNPEFAQEVEKASNLGVRSLNVVEATVPSLTLASHSLTLAVHGTPGQPGVEPLLAPWIAKVPDALAGTQASGVSFQHEWPDGESRGSLLLEQSGMVEGGALIRVTSEHAGRLATPEVVQRGMDFFASTIDIFDLSLGWSR